jgi:hypothetical protein
MPFIGAVMRAIFSAGICGPLSLHVVAIREQYQPDVLERPSGGDEVGFRNMGRQPIRPDIEICFQLLESAGARGRELKALPAPVVLVGRIASRSLGDQRVRQPPGRDIVSLSSKDSEVASYVLSSC